MNVLPKLMLMSSVQDQRSERESKGQDGLKSRFGRHIKSINRLIQTMSTQTVHAIHEI